MGPRGPQYRTGTTRSFGSENGGYDVAKIHDTAGDDVLAAGDNWTSLSVDLAGRLDLLYEAIGFDVVRAYRSEGRDIAPGTAAIDHLMLKGRGAKKLSRRRNPLKMRISRSPAA